jgi:hypothetical protein
LRIQRTASSFACRDWFAAFVIVGHMLLRKMSPDTFPLFVA